MKKLFKFYENCGRMGDLSGIFIAEQEDVDKLLGKEIWLGEVLGKHSGISVTIDADSITALTDDQDFIEKFEEFGCASGIDLFDYLND